MNAALAGTMFAGKVHHFTLIGSTQTRALADAVAGADAGQVYIADQQTAGRGRGGHTWRSEPDLGLYLTVLVRPEIPGNEVLLLSLAAALAAQASVRKVTGIEIDLRWPNDLVVPVAGGLSLKVGVILTESATSAAGVVRYAAIGMGINLNQIGFDEELRRSATSLRLIGGLAICREDLAVALLRTLHIELSQMASSPSVLERFAAASSWVSGKRVRVAEEDGYTGVTEGLTGDGLLRVRVTSPGTGSDAVRIVRHGGVREA